MTCPNCGNPDLSSITIQGRIRIVCPDCFEAWWREGQPDAPSLFYEATPDSSKPTSTPQK